MGKVWHAGPCPRKLRYSQSCPIVVKAVFIALILPKVNLVLSPHGRVHALTIAFDGIIIIIIIIMDRTLNFLLRVSRLMSLCDLRIEVFLHKIL
jgi:hypothetical protein